MRTLLTALLATAVLAGLASAAPAPPGSVLGIEWRAGGGQLAWRSATTLRPQGKVVDVGGASVSLAAVSPDGRLAALTRTDGQIRILRLRPLGSVGTLQTGGKYIPAAFWPAPDRLVAVVGGQAPAVIVIDAGARRVTARRRLEGALYGAVANRRGLVALLAPAAGIGQARLAVVAPDGSFRTVALPGVSAGFTPSAEPEPQGTGRMATPGLDLSPDGMKAAVVGLDTLLTVDLASLEIAQHPTRALARVTKRVEGWSRSVVWLKRDTLAVIARTNGYEGDRPVRTTSGIRLHLLGREKTQLLDETATGLTRVGDTLLASGGTALRGYALDGSLSFELLAGRDTGYVQTTGRFAYIGSHNSTRFVVVDVQAGRALGSARTLQPTIVLDL